MHFFCSSCIWKIFTGKLKCENSDLCYLSIPHILSLESRCATRNFKNVIKIRLELSEKTQGYILLFIC